MKKTLEDHIMSCWNLVDEISFLSTAIGDEKLKTTDEILNVLNGLTTLYQCKFEDLMEQLEKDLATRRTPLASATREQGNGSCI